METEIRRILNLDNPVLLTIFNQLYIRIQVQRDGPKYTMIMFQKTISLLR